MKNSYRFFENRDCEYFPCHKGLTDFNCLFCYCPFYLLDDDCPGHPNFIPKEDGFIKDCTGCNNPHVPENYDAIMKYIGDHIVRRRDDHE